MSNMSNCDFNTGGAGDCLPCNNGADCPSPYQGCYDGVNNNGTEKGCLCFGIYGRVYDVESGECTAVDLGCKVTWVIVSFLVASMFAVVFVRACRQMFQLHRAGNFVLPGLSSKNATKNNAKLGMPCLTLLLTTIAAFLLGAASAIQVFDAAGFDASMSGEKLVKPVIMSLGGGFAMISVLFVSIVWIDTAQSSEKMKAGKGKWLQIACRVALGTSVATFLWVVVFMAAGQQTMATIMPLGLTPFVSATYVVGSRKLARLLSSMTRSSTSNDRQAAANQRVAALGVRIVRCANGVVTGLLFFFSACLAFAMLEPRGCSPLRSFMGAAFSGGWALALLSCTTFVVRSTQSNTRTKKSSKVGSVKSTAVTGASAVSSIAAVSSAGGNSTKSAGKTSGNTSLTSVTSQQSTDLASGTASTIKKL